MSLLPFWSLQFYRELPFIVGVDSVDLEIVRGGLRVRGHRGDPPSGGPVQAPKRPFARHRAHHSLTPFPSE